MDNSLPWWLRGALPLAVAWVRWWEWRIRRRGQPLTGVALAAARGLGVRDPARVRLRFTPHIPCRMPGFLRRYLVRRGWLPGDVAGMALGHGILLRPERARDLELIRHELAHVAQYERLGGVREFLGCYLGECLRVGYQGSALEAEARRLARQASDPVRDQSPANAGP